jgi:uncharacterized protein (TIGR02231 family)
MKTLKLIAAFFILSVFTNPASAETLKANSKIDGVVVFSDRALITRSAEVNLSQGSHQIIFENLPGILEPDSISSKGEGEAKVKLFGVRIDTKQLTESQPPRVQEIERQLLGLQARELAIQDSKKIAAAKEEFLMSIKAASSEQIGKDIVTKTPSVPDVQKLLEVLDKELNAAYQINRESDFEMQEIYRKRDQLQRELNEINQNFYQKQQVSLIVDLEAETNGRFHLTVSYRVPQASWEPIYEARATSPAKDVQLIANALVRQRTGEDWENVQLELSTARPALGGRMPEIQPWYLQKYEPPVLYRRETRAGLASMREAEMLKSADFQSGAVAADNMVAAQAPMPASIPTATIETQGATVHFKLPHQESIASNWQPRKVTVQNFTFPAEFANEVTPRLALFAYLRAKVQNNSETILLPGQVQIFLDSAFVGSSFVDLVGVNEKFDLYLGVNDKIRVEQKQLTAKEDVSVLAGFHGKIKTIDYVYLTTIENFQREEADIHVFDQVPVSQNDEIKVDQIKMDPKPTEQDPEKPGVSIWKFKIAAGAKQTIKMSYQVKHPVEFKVPNL